MILERKREKRANNVSNFEIENEINFASIIEFTKAPIIFKEFLENPKRFYDLANLICVILLVFIKNKTINDRNTG